MRAKVVFLIAVGALVSGCKHTTPPTAEQALRTRLGIPAAAKEVMILSQSSHLDLDWQRTFDDYYSTWVEKIFLGARQLLDQQPRAVYSVAEMAFLKAHLEKHPEELPAIQSLVKSGAWQLVGGGMSSPDSILPETELLMRDYLYGQMFIEDTLGGHATAAWLPDSFGLSGTFPDILAAVGLKAVGFSRADGSLTFTQFLSNPDASPLPGSTAEKLRELGSNDFIWQGPGGGSVLAHYLPDNLYCMGDDIDIEVALEFPGQITGTPNQTPEYTDGQIRKYADALRPYTKTPYMFVPVGCDFQSPKPQLLTYIDGWNQRQYPSTGIWAVAATFQDYSELVLAHKDELPVLQADLTPYYMGFYGTRADVKQQVRAAARPLFTAETFASALGADGQAIMLQAQPSFELLTRSDHHDFITGTSTDMVATTEQLPLLASIEMAGDAAVTSVATSIAARIPPVSGSIGRIVTLNPSGEQQSEVVQVTVPSNFLPAQGVDAQANGHSIPVLAQTAAGASSQVRLLLENMPPFSWQAIDLLPGTPVAPTSSVSLQLLDANGDPTDPAKATTVILSNSHVVARWERTTGFALTSLKIDGNEALAGPSFQINQYNDMGGLWRLGNEMPESAGYSASLTTGGPCSLTLIPPQTADEAAETLQVVENDAIGVHVSFVSPVGTREAWLDPDSTGLDVALTTSAATHMMVTAQFTFADATNGPWRTSQPGGYLDRPLERLYSPTYWAAVNWASAGGWGVLLKQSTGVRFDAQGDVELMAVRNAPREECDVEGGVGTDTGTHRIAWRIEPVASPADAEQRAQRFNRPIVAVPITTTETGTSLAPQQSLLQASGDGVVTAIKPAERGPGIIVRAQLMPGPVTLQLSPILAGSEATRVDAAEHDLSKLGKVGTTLTLDRAHYGAIASVRLVPP